jgi:hypothetical protein
MGRIEAQATGEEPMGTRPLAFAIMLSMAVMTSGSSTAEEDENSSLVEQGYAISPIPKSRLNLTGKDYATVGWGSYIVNGLSDCSGCHSFPQFLEKGNAAGSDQATGDPFEGTPTSRNPRASIANFNVSHYLAGGQCFGPFMTRNLTPDPNGLPEGLTEKEFVTALRTGEDIHCEKSPSDPICALGPDTPTLQVMPWPAYHGLRATDLKAVYAYLSALPAAEPCNTVANGCPGFSGAAAGSQDYVYPPTNDCPNPAPPQ